MKKVKKPWKLLVPMLERLLCHGSISTTGIGADGIEQIDCLKDALKFENTK